MYNFVHVIYELYIVQYVLLYSGKIWFITSKLELDIQYNNTHTQVASRDAHNL